MGLMREASERLPIDGRSSEALRRLSSRSTGAEFRQITDPIKEAAPLRHWLPTIERFDAQDGREMPRDLLPALALVETGKDRSAIGPEVHAHRLAFVTPHGLPQNGEVAGFLW
jgi:hypothetical protein